MFKLNKKSLIYAAVFLLFLVFLSSFTPALKTPLLFSLKYPFTLLRLIRREIGGIIFYHSNLLQNERLKREVDLLKQKLNSARELSLENSRLKELLSLKEKSAHQLIAATVIARSPESWSSVVIINKGRQSGIRNGFVVINYSGLVGRVVETGVYTSKVMLINDPALSVSGLLQRSRQEGLVSGTLGSTLVMKYLPVDADIQVSDIIVTSGLTPAYPKGLMIGTVTKIDEEFSGLSRYAIIKPAVKLSDIEEVLVIIK